MTINDASFSARPGGLPEYVQYYVMRQTGGDPANIYFTRGPLAEASPTDPEIDICVWIPCTICIDLDPAGGWQFQTGTPATLGSSAEATRYYNLTPGSNSMQIQFGADHCHVKGNIDHFNVFIVTSSGQDYRIDPDIKNPGDPDG